MLKTLKWMYDLGVRQERTRIARELENAMTRHHNAASISNSMLRDPETKEQRKNRLQFREAVHHEVLEIVNVIMQPHSAEQFPTSVMFPEGEK